ncbi:MAG: UDP-N-acetylmuramoyl-L-alanyl-D-glutamate--2,6-diaminopimelate ligase [Parcubacteria group bacterium]|nr:UDP-N-acetylmuramoyl-L-alanyl-D-glutamate--2,6-diaminopimelate ligase [Parcubacteria group bacterium]
METILNIGRKIIPKKIFQTAQPVYHFLLALSGAFYYKFPSQKIFVVAVTGTKGKTSVTEMINEILNEAGYKTALLNTIHFKIGDKEERNLFKMSMPGRFFIQRFLRNAVNANCKYAVIEMTSEGAKQLRHKFISLDTLIFTNIAPEHIESHGSFENYLNAKLKIAHSLENSSKNNKTIIANSDDEYGGKFLNIKVSNKIPLSLKDAEPYMLSEKFTEITFDGLKMHLKIVGTFNIYNALSAMKFAKSQNIDTMAIRSAVEKFEGAKGRVERIEEGQNFTVIVDYAHTKESLEALYKAFDKSDKICVLGNTGGGRDKWKRPDMAKIADTHCNHTILTNEDPYDEDPMQIIKEMASGIKTHTPEIILDRREAIRRALTLAKENDIVLITGKGTDPYIMEAKGKKTPWSDTQVAKEELNKYIFKT